MTKIEEVMVASPPLHPSTAAVDLMLAVGRLQVRERYPAAREEPLRTQLQPFLQVFDRPIW